MKRSDFCIVITDVAACGQDSILDPLRNASRSFSFSISYTTRSPRLGEKEGVDYHFVTKDRFEQARANKEFFEWQEIDGEFFGIKKADLDEILKTDKVPIFLVNFAGLRKIKKHFRHTVSIMITPPDLEEAARRLQQRGGEKETVDRQVERYRDELSHSHHYHHIIINNDLSNSRAELVDIVRMAQKKEKEFHHLNNIFFKLLIFAGLFIVLGSSLIYAKYWRGKHASITAQPIFVDSSTSPTSNSDTGTAPATVTPTAPNVTQNVVKNPPKYTSAKNPVQSSTKNSNGTQTTTISTGSTATQSDLARAASDPAPASPLDVTFRDETGAHADLGPILLNYLNSTLHWKGEIGSLKEITLRDAGASGWSGQYQGQYTVSADGKTIVSETGYIILNSYYYTSSPYFNDYMRLILSHEYGHHYTLYHKWMDWNLPVGIRFPDSYYSTRPLSKVTTATDYSKGWSNCELEIIAEDYSYLYSGFGYSAVVATYGYPSAALRSWMENIGDASLLTNVTNTAPTIAITSPADGATLSGSLSFSADASDDYGVAKVSFYVGSQLIADDTTAPYSATLGTTGFPNGDYTLRAVASDGVLAKEADVTVHFQNESVDLEKPTISIVAPTDNPYTLTATSFNLSVSAADNVAIDRIELYLDDNYQNSWKTSLLNLSVSFSGIPAGTYALKFRAYDTAGNYTDVTLSVIKP